LPQNGEVMSDTIISFDNFTYSYPDGNLALSDITFEVKSGESVGIIGHNGSGKSTLFMNIVGILDANKGITVCGLPVNKKNIPSVRSKVGYIFQDPRDQLFMSRVIEDVAFGPLNMGISREDAYIKSKKALELVGLSGFDNRISYHLSAGEMQLAVDWQAVPALFSWLARCGWSLAGTICST